MRSRILAWPFHLRALALIGSVLVLDLVVSVLLPYLHYALVTGPAWQADFEQCAARHAHCVPPIPRGMVWSSILVEYRLDLTASLVGLYLFVMPVMWFHHGVAWFPWQPFVWLAAVALGALHLRGARGVALVPRVLSSLLLALLLSGFAAYHWSTLGD